MDENKIKQMRKIILPQIRIAKDRIDSASLVLEGEWTADAIPILFKAVDVTVRALLSFKQKPIADFQENVSRLEEEYKEDRICDGQTVQLLNSLYEMNKKYMKEIDLQYDDNAVKDIFEKAENFVVKAEKYLKNRLTTQKERIRKKRIRKILVISGISLGLAILIFFLVKVGTNIFGPEHGLLAHYYDNIYLKQPVEVQRIDKKIDFVWGRSSPQKNIAGEFSVRWEGRIKIDKNDIYTFHISSDEGVRLFLDDKLIINTWSRKKRAQEHSAQVKLKKGFHKIKIEYFFNQRHADIKLLWSSSSFKKRIIPSKVLYPPASQEVSRK